MFIKRQTGIILFLNVCRVEYNINLQGSTGPDFPHFFYFLILSDSLKIAWIEIFFLKVFIKAYPVVFSSNLLKMSVWLAIEKSLEKKNSRKILFCSLFTENSRKVSVLFGMNSEKILYYCLVVTQWKYQYSLT